MDGDEIRLVRKDDDKISQYLNGEICIEVTF